LASCVRIWSGDRGSTMFAILLQFQCWQHHWKRILTSALDMRASAGGEWAGRDGERKCSGSLRLQVDTVQD
jgi:hypothetical protein